MWLMQFNVFFCNVSWVESTNHSTYLIYFLFCSYGYTHNCRQFSHYAIIDYIIEHSLYFYGSTQSRVEEKMCGGAIWTVLTMTAVIWLANYVIQNSMTVTALPTRTHTDTDQFHPQSQSLFLRSNGIALFMWVGTVTRVKLQVTGHYSDRVRFDLFLMPVTMSVSWNSV